MGTDDAALPHRVCRASTFLPCYPWSRFVLPGLFVASCRSHLAGHCGTSCRRRASGTSCRRRASGTMRALTPVRSRPRRTGLSVYFALPSEHPAPNHVMAQPCSARTCVSMSLCHISASSEVLRTKGFAKLRQARRITPPKRVRHPAGCSFASGCSPPRIAATQLPSATCVMTSHGSDLHLPDKTTSQTHRSRAPPRRIWTRRSRHWPSPAIPSDGTAR